MGSHVTTPAGPVRSEGVMEAGLERVPGWEKYGWLQAGFSTRQGGLSRVYGEAEQNLGWTAEDDPAIVRANRESFVRAVGDGAALEMVTVSQVHSATVRDLEQEPSPWMTADGKAQMKGDGLVSRQAGRLLAVLTADCVPVLLADTRTHAVGAFHAGWRGTLARIVEVGVATMREQYGSQPADLIAAIGPCIRACCFEVGPEVCEAYEQAFPYAAELFSAHGEGRLHMDLVAANRRQLMDAGLRGENVSVLGHCTACARLGDGRRRFFSYRAERGVTGRMLSGIAAVA